MDSKVSFGFKNVPKKPSLILNNKPQEKKVELIECFEGQNMKIKGVVKAQKKELVIPMLGADKTLLDRVKEANELKERSFKRFEPKESVEDTRPDSELSLDELAARKLLQEARNTNNKAQAAKVTKIMAVEDNLILEGAKEPTLDDYEQVPISDYGYAILRGMGWSENLEKKRKIDAPELRAKGMGLGADKMIKKATESKLAVDKNGIELSLVKGARAKIIAGKEKGTYCTVEGFDEDSCRIIVKSALNGSVLSLNEFLLLPVTQEEFAKSSKILNNAKYEEYLAKSERNEETKKESNGKLKNGDSSQLKSVESRSLSQNLRSRSREKYRSKPQVPSTDSDKSRSRSRSRSRSHKKHKKAQHKSKKYESDSYSDESDQDVKKTHKKSKRKDSKSKKTSRSKSKKSKKHSNKSKTRRKSTTDSEDSSSSSSEERDTRRRH